MGAFSVEGNTLAYANGGYTPESQLVAVDRLGRRLGPIGDPAEIIGFDVAPDEQTAVLEVRDPIENTVNLWLMDLRTGTRTRFTFSDWWNAQPLWSPNGRQIAFLDDLTYGVNISAVGGGTPSLIRDGSLMPQSWSPDGKLLVIGHDGGLETAFDLQVLSVEDGSVEMYLNSEFTEWEASVSPDSNWLAYVSDEDGDFGVYVDAFPAAGRKVRIGGGTHPLWRQDGTELYYLTPDHQLMVVDVVSGGSDLRTSTPRVLFQAPEIVDETRREYAVLDNGERFVFNAVHDGAEPRSITVLKNWKLLLEE